MKKSFLVLVVLFSTFSVFASGSGDSGNIDKGELRLTLLHTNDVHSHLDVDYKGRYGVGKAAAAIQKIRSEKDNVLLLDAGDFVMGTIYYTIFNGEAEKNVINKMKYDAMVLGNHEFDKGNGSLMAFLTGLETPVVATNISFPSADLQDMTVPVLIKDVNGRSVAILGATTGDTSFLSSPDEGTVFAPVVKSIQKEVKKLQKQGIDIIVLLSHCGYEDDLQFGAELSGVDVIIGGHSHTVLEDNYPTVIDSAAGEPVLIVQAAEYAKILGQLEVTFDGQGIATSWEGSPVSLGADAPLEQDITAYIAELNEELKPYTSEVLGSSSVELTRSRSAESPLGNLITDAMLEYLQPQGIQIALTNSGGIRANLGAGEITMQQLMEVLPFGNLAATFDIKGSDLWEVFEHGLSGIETNAGRFLQMSGAKILYNPANPVGERLLDVQVKDVDGNWNPLDPDAQYKVAANNYIRGGGDDFQVLKEKAINPYDSGALDIDIMRAYLEGHSPVSPVIENRITVKE